MINRCQSHSFELNIFACGGGGGNHLRIFFSFNKLQSDSSGFASDLTR